MDKQTIQEIITLKERLFNAEKKLSDFADILHAESQQDITDLDAMVVDMAYDNLLNELEV